MSEGVRTVSLRYNQDEIRLECRDDESLLEAMVRKGLNYQADCGGRGTCGKCKIRVLEGDLNISSQDKKVLTTQQLQQGIRLACKAYPQNETIIELQPQKEEEIEVVTNYARVSSQEHQDSTSKYQGAEDKSLEYAKKGQGAQDKSLEYAKKGQGAEDTSLENTGKDQGVLDAFIEYTGKDQENPDKSIEIARSDHDNVDKPYGIAIDLGTTTIAFSLIEIRSKRIVETVTAVNRQRNYGSDVISRMKAANEGKAVELREIISQELERGIWSLLQRVEIDLTRIRSIVISGNTTMGHLLMGYSCETLGVYPFLPVNINTITLPYRELLSGDNGIPITILPGISAFVGGDIVSGIFACDIHHSDKPCLFIDLGTNGEMAIGNKENILVASTAAGPAFEGGNLTYGVPSIPGAIRQISISSTDIRIDTIQGEAPIGICGTGAIELLSELLTNGIMDETGLLKDPYFEEGYPIADFALYQKDIRELQLAKAAIRAGIEILTRRYGITYEDIDRVYLAGGFGYQLDIRKAVNIGLLPRELQDKLVTVGNSSLAGAVSAVLDQEVIKNMNELIQISSEIQLSNDIDFNDLFIASISF